MRPSEGGRVLRALLPSSGGLGDQLQLALASGGSLREEVQAEHRVPRCRNCCLRGSEGEVPGQAGRTADSVSSARGLRAGASPSRKTVLCGTLGRRGGPASFSRAAGALGDWACHRSRPGARPGRRAWPVGAVAGKGPHFRPGRQRPASIPPSLRLLPSPGVY